MLPPGMKLSTLTESRDSVRPQLPALSAMCCPVPFPAVPVRSCRCSPAVAVAVAVAVQSNSCRQQSRCGISKPSRRISYRGCNTHSDSREPPLSG